VTPERPEGTEETRRTPRAVTYPYRRIERVEVTPPDGEDPYGDSEPAWLKIDWQQHLRTIEVGEATINYAEMGDGPETIIFVHGLGGCWQNWLENMPRLAELGYRAIAFDLPGFGSSPMPPWPISIPDYGMLLGHLREALGVGTCTLVGNSMGGFIAAEVAVGEPEWVDRLVLVSSAGISHATMRRGPVVAGARVSILANPLLRRIDIASMKRARLRKLALGGVIRHPERMPREMLVEFLAPALGAPGFVPAVAALTGYNLLDRLERIRVPTLIVWGRDDLVVPAADATGFLERIPGSELVVFDDCGHVPMAEHPTRFNRLLARFCATGHG
jgi:pimeloyl-ACP methyl ester carboxylesterase